VEATGLFDSEAREAAHDGADYPDDVISVARNTAVSVPVHLRP